MSSLLRCLVGALLLVSLASQLSPRDVDDPAQDAARYHKDFALFRSANMPGADKLPSGIGHWFRIPAVVTTSICRILAFAEGRRHDHRDYGDINLVYKQTRTTDSHGASLSDWEGLQEVVGKGPGTWGNPTPVVDRSTIYLFLSWNSGASSQNGGDFLPDGTVTKKIDHTWEGRRHLYLTLSTDDGKTWSDPEDLTKTLTPTTKAWDAVGPGRGINLKTGELAIAADGRNIIGTGTPGKRTWKCHALPGAGSEGTIAQTFDGKLYRNDRGRSGDGYRKVARGTLFSFSSFSLDTGLPDPGCEGSTLLYNLADAKDPARLIFMNSADESSRWKMRVRVTYDDDVAKFDHGRKLSDALVPGAGYEGGYSSITKTADFRIGALVETDHYQTGGSKDDHRAIVWKRFNLSW